MASNKKNDAVKVLPQAIDLEKYVLGSIMNEATAFDRVASILPVEAFYVPAHQIIYETMRTLQAKNQPSDYMMICQQLIKTKQMDAVGGPFEVTEISKHGNSTAAIESYAMMIVEKFIARKMITSCHEILNQCYDESNDVFAVLQEAESMILSIGKEHISNDMVSVDQVVHETVKRIEENKAVGKLVNGVPTGVKKVDGATRGWQNGDLIILAARPAVGKTAKALKLAKAAVADGDRKVAFFSLEMDRVQLVMRMLSEVTETPLFRLQTGFLKDEDVDKLYKKGVQELSRNNIFFDDAPGLNLFKLRSKCRRMKKKYPDLSLIIIDYLQLMESDVKGTREQQVSSISRGLKLLAKELQVPIIALSQLNRNLDGKSGKTREPQLTDLRESGALEQDADVVIMMWEPDEDELKKNPSLENVRYGKIAKNRNGVLLRYEMNFKKNIQRIEQREDEPAGGWRKTDDEGNKVSEPNQGDLPF